MFLSCSFGVGAIVFLSRDSFLYNFEDHKNTFFIHESCHGRRILLQCRLLYTYVGLSPTSSKVTPFSWRCVGRTNVSPSMVSILPLEVLAPVWNTSLIEDDSGFRSTSSTLLLI